MAEARREPGRVPAIILAVLVHLAFIGLLVFGVDWQTREPAPVIAELWNSLPGAAPAPPPAKPEPAPEPMPAPRPEPKPEPKPEPAPKPTPPKPEPRPEPKPEQADIELKVKAEKLKNEKRKLEEDKDKLAKIKKQQDDAADLKRLQDEIKKEQQVLEDQRNADDRTREANEAAKRARATAQTSEIARYTGQIRDKIRGNIVMPPNIIGNPQAEIEVTVIPTGEVINVRVKKSSGNVTYDSAVERAIRKSSPLPLPPSDRGLFETFREQHLKFRPNE